MSKLELAQKHSFFQDCLFRFKASVLSLKRHAEDLQQSIKRFPKQNHLLHEPIVASSESDLWNALDNKKNWILTAGKVQNLRLAAQKLHGVEVEANKVFSFWKHVGNPHFNQGFVVGREVREGCIIPTIAGGLCQLSNALYDAALQSNFEIIERHKHSQVVAGSLAEQDRDATVKHNYIDLRFKSEYDFRIEAELSTEKLIVRFKAKQTSQAKEHASSSSRAANHLNDCYSCGNLACFKHPDRSNIKQEIATTCYLLDERWPEFDQYIHSIAQPSDQFIIPMGKNPFFKTRRYQWDSPKEKPTKHLFFPTLLRAVLLRLAPKSKNNVFELMLKLDKAIAKSAAKKIPLDCTHIVISQNLLPFVYASGALGGRSYQVLMTRLPFDEIHQRLDYAHKRYPSSPTLHDFRAPESLLALERQALAKSEKIITPHSQLAKLYEFKAIQLDWQIPLMSTKVQNEHAKQVLFPASAVGRKGAYALREIAQKLRLNLAITGRNLEGEDFWKGLHVTTFNGNYEQIKLVFYPAIIENQPRQVLRAIAKGIPVIASTSTGLKPSNQVKLFEPDDLEGMLQAVQELIN